MGILSGAVFMRTGNLVEPAPGGNDGRRAAGKPLAPGRPDTVACPAMSLTARIDQDIKEAMKAKDSDRLGALRMLKSSLKYAAIEKGTGAETGLSDAEAVNVIRKRVKQCRDAIAGFAQGDRPGLAAKEQAEVELLESYLPAALPAAELSGMVRRAIAETGATGMAQMGAVMKIVMAAAAGRADGQAVNAEVRKQLG